MTNENGEVIPPEIEEEIENALSEEEIIGSYSNSSGDNGERLSIIREWLPGGDSHKGKTNISIHQARAIALAGNITTVFDEMPDEYAEYIDEVIDDYLQLLTSVDGVSREQQIHVLASMVGSGEKEEQETESAVRAAISATKEDNND